MKLKLQPSTTKDLPNTKTSMNSFDRVLNSRMLLLSFQLLVAVSLVTNIYYTTKITSCNNLNKQIATINENLNQELSRYDNLEAYENSLSFQEKSFRNRGFKLKDETVIDTAAVEPLPENPEEVFIPKERSEDENNVVSWINYLQGKKNITGDSNLVCS